MLQALKEIRLNKFLSNLVPLYLIFHNRYCHSVRQQLFQWRNNLEYRWPAGFYSWSHISSGLCERVFWKWQLHRLYLVWECWVGSIVEFLTSKLLIIFSINKSKIWLLCTITSMQHIWVCFRKDTFQSNQVWLVGFDTTLHFSFKESLKGCVKSNWIFCVSIDTNMSISQSCILMSHWGHMMVNGAEFWIICKQLKTIEKSWSLTNSAPSTIILRQCDIQFTYT